METLKKLFDQHNGKIKLYRIEIEPFSESMVLYRTEGCHFCPTEDFGVYPSPVPMDILQNRIERCAKAIVEKHDFTHDEKNDCKRLEDLQIWERVKACSTTSFYPDQLFKIKETGVDDGQK